MSLCSYPAACNYLNADASSKINEFNCKASFAVDQFYQRLVASRSPGSWAQLSDDQPPLIRCEVTTACVRGVTSDRGITPWPPVRVTRRSLLLWEEFPKVKSSPQLGFERHLSVHKLLGIIAYNASAYRFSVSLVFNKSNLLLYSLGKICSPNTHFILHVLMRVSQIWVVSATRCHPFCPVPGHLLHYLCCQVFHCVSCHLCCCYSRNLWSLQRPGRWWELEQWLDYTNLVTDVTCRDVSFVMGWHVLTFPDTGDFWPGSTWCLWGHTSCGASFRCQRQTWALFGDWESISPGVIVIVNQ